MQLSLRLLASFCMPLAVLLAAVSCNRPAENTAASGQAAEDAPMTLHLLLPALPDATAGGYVYAEERGLYQKAGLTVRVSHEAPADAEAPENILICDALQFLERIREGEDLVAVLAPFQDSPSCVFVWQDSALTTGLEKLEGATIHGDTSDPQWAFLSKRYEMPPLALEKPDPEFEAFSQNSTCAVAGDHVHDLARLGTRGVTTQTLLISDSGFNPYCGLLAVPRPLLESQPDAIRALVQASLRGWLGYLSAPQAISPQLAERNPKLNASEWTAAGVRARRFVLTGAAESGVIGVMTAARWAKMVHQLEGFAESEPTLPAPGNLFTNEFLQ